MTTSFLADRLPHDEPAPGRAARHPRSSVMLSAVIGHSDGRTSRHRARDLAPGGIRVDQVDDLRVGAAVTVSVGALEAVDATVAWVAASSAGLAFAERVDPERARKRTMEVARRAGEPDMRRMAVERQTDTGPSSAPPASAGWIADLRNPYDR